MSSLKQDIQPSEPPDDLPWPHVRLSGTDRLENFSDNVFSITLTLLVAEIVRPEYTPGQLLDKLAAFYGMTSEG